MNQCSMCGNQYPDGSPYCPRCGTLTENESGAGADIAGGAPHTDSGRHAAWLSVVHPDNSTDRYEISHRLSVGRENADVKIPDDERLSRHHLEVRADGPDYVLKDMGSANGTYVKARRPVPIRSGDRIVLNGKWYTFRA